MGAAATNARYEQAVRRRHDLEQRIRELEARPDNPGRATLIRRLREELKEAKAACLEVTPESAKIPTSRSASGNSARHSRKEETPV